MSNGMNKWDKINLLIQKVGAWVDAVDDGVDDDSAFATIEEELKAAYELLTNHAVREKKVVEDHPDAEYFTITIEDKEIRRARCKHCGKEVHPKHFARHYKSVLCERIRANRLGIEPPKVRTKKSKKSKEKNQQEAAE